MQLKSRKRLKGKRFNFFFVCGAERNIYKRVIAHIFADIIVNTLSLIIQLQLIGSVASK